ncbi:MAG TPA: MraY family glycosyltransferase [Planctomycetota bacterium]|nr:MraY family glycosyltransferase [Planctomycetota bacterium]
MLIAFALVGVLSFLITLNLVPRVARLALRAGFLDRPGERKIHTRPIPYGGGIAVAVGMFATILGGLLAAWFHAQFGVLGNAPEIVEHLPGLASRVPQLLSILLGGAAFMLLGLVDDKVKLTPMFRLAVEAVVAFGVSLTIDPLSLFMGEGLTAAILGRVVTVVWIVAVANMFNLLDHFDGLSSGVALIAGLAFFLVALATGQLFIAALLAALMGSVAGFLVFNFPPAKIFLGDAGSLFIGYMLGVLCVLFTFYSAPFPPFSYLVPFAVLAVPMLDTAFVCVARMRAGRSIFQGDRRHLAHRLSAMGLGPRGVLAVVYGLTLISGIGALLLYEVRLAGALGILAQIGVVFIIITVLERAGKTNGRE